MAPGPKTAELTDAQVHAIARALADPRRYEILQRLAANPGACTACADMRECIKISPATLSHHMKELDAAGLVTSAREGKFMRYRLNSATLRAYRARLAADLL